jgi:hypothetical protein
MGIGCYKLFIFGRGKYDFIFFITRYLFGNIISFTYYCLLKRIIKKHTIYTKHNILVYDFKFCQWPNGKKHIIKSLRGDGLSLSI